MDPAGGETHIQQNIVGDAHLYRTATILQFKLTDDTVGGWIRNFFCWRIIRVRGSGDTASWIIRGGDRDLRWHVHNRDRNRRLGDYGRRRGERSEI